MEKTLISKSGKEYSISELQALMTDEWNNNSCLGYCIMALEQLNYSKSDIQNVVNKMYDLFDQTTIQESSEHYYNTPY